MPQATNSRLLRLLQEVVQLGQDEGVSVVELKQSMAGVPQEQSGWSRLRNRFRRSNLTATLRKIKTFIEQELGITQQVANIDEQEMTRLKHHFSNSSATIHLLQGISQMVNRDDAMQSLQITDDSLKIIDEIIETLEHASVRTVIHGIRVIQRKTVWEERHIKDFDEDVKEVVESQDHQALQNPNLVSAIEEMQTSLQKILEQVTGEILQLRGDAQQVAQEEKTMMHVAQETEHALQGLHTALTKFKDDKNETHLNEAKQFASQAAALYQELFKQDSIFMKLLAKEYADCSDFFSALKGFQEATNNAYSELTKILETTAT